MTGIPTVVPQCIVDAINAKLNDIKAPDVTYDDLFLYIQITEQNKTPDKGWVEYCLEGINIYQDEMRLYK